MSLMRRHEIPLDDDEYNAVISQYKYGLAEVEGTVWQRWQTDPEDPSCKIKNARFTVRILKHIYNWTVYELFSPLTRDPVLDPPPSRTMEAVTHCELSVDLDYKSIRLVKYAELANPFQNILLNTYHMIIGPGVIFSVNCKRTEGPFWSEIALAAYNHYEDDELEYVFRMDVINRTTRSIVREVYKKNNIQWPDYNRSHWKFDTPEHRAIMATPNGSGVVALVLGGFERGTKYISEIVTWADRERSNLQMLFIISDLPDYIG